MFEIINGKAKEEHIRLRIAEKSQGILSVSWIARQTEEGNDEKM